MRFRLFLLVLGLMSAACWASRPSASFSAAPSLDAPHIIFITVDAVRPDHLSAYGYERETSPTFDRISAEGVLFADASAPAPWTYPSNASTLSAAMPSELGTVWSDANSQLPTDVDFLAEYLHQAGYATVGVTSAYYTFSQFGFDQGFDYYHDLKDDRTASAVNAATINWLNGNWSAEKSNQQPLFLYLYYFDPHSWYTPPAPYDTMYDADYDGPLTGEVFGHGEIVVSGEYVPTERDVDHLKALYDGEIRYWDDEMGAMLAHLETLGLLENSLIVILSDHGQQFGEHDKWLHRSSLYEETIRVPLALHYPDRLAAGTVIPSAVSLVDLMPTVLDLAGVDVPTDLQAQSLVPLLDGDAVETRPIFSELDKVTDPDHSAYWITPHTNHYAVKQDGWKYIHIQGATTPADELYELAPTSIFEGENVIETNPNSAEMMWSLLQQRFSLPTETLFLPSVVGTPETN